MSHSRWSVRSVVGVGQVPADFAQLVTLPRYDYLDAFTLEFPEADRWSAEQWARAMFIDDRPLLLRAVTRGLLGVMLSRPGSPDRIGDYTIAVSELGVLRGRVESPRSADQVVVVVAGDSVSLVTAVHRATPSGRRMWAVISHLHRFFAPRVLRYAAARLPVTRLTVRAGA
ncbi:hypothetical protein E4V99_09120 [Microbacterium sp. dk485]|uniref:hypothetical protein n=1 Tax=Microbacterium sp. dk485 TaxID=2560021 RepID=UPI001073C57B|nr:hypothetical protein [Microbacterium sp. dk485]TFV85155.1 hypothetical protein E4V99_09120 [Microbacterium sp. dk485]